MDSIHTTSASLPLYARRAASGHLAARASATSAVFAVLAADTATYTLARSRVTHPARVCLASLAGVGVDGRVLADAQPG